ncbi:DUF669 domain-containing protein [Xanthobacter sp. DSM 24535]|uniref:DUF669 domain-containing protein n=1 Tax=Roseixanthobacter psychrophilus TaxID=3119917 RepID=UPI003727E5F7
MADLGMTFNADEVPPDEFEKLPVGRYLVQITDSDVKENSKGTGKFAGFSMTVMEGHEENRTWYEAANYVHDDSGVERRGLQTLASIGRVCGKPQASKTEEWHFIPFFITVEDYTSKQGKTSRVIREYSVYDPSSHGGARTTQQRPASRPQPQAAQQQRPSGGAPARGANTGASGPRTWRAPAQRPPAAPVHDQMDDEIPF